MKTLITHLEPRRVMLVHGSRIDTAALREHLQHALSGVPIEAPEQGQTMECTFDSAMYRLDLSQDILSKTPVRSICGHRVGWVDGIVGKSPHADGPNALALLLPPDKNIADLSMHYDSCQAHDNHNLNVFASEAVSPAEYGGFVPQNALVHAENITGGAGSTFVGNLKLSDFKLALASADIAAEFFLGSLMCTRGTNCIRKEADDKTERLTLDGNLSDDFYRIRSVLYDRYQIKT
jgi:cleavage and polyadenylation specificity factor subunit 2